MRKSERGMSLIELVVVLAVVSGLMVIIYSLVEEAMKAAMFGESHNDMTIMTQRVVNRLQSEVLQSRVAFQEDVNGGAYRDAMQIPAQPAKWPDTLLPVFQSDATLDPDTGNGADRYAGNSLLIVRQLAPLSILYDDDGNAGTPDVEFLADHYRFEYEYPVMNDARSFGGTGFYLDLMESRSGEYADYFQLASLTAAQMKAIVPRIQATGIARAWDPGQPIDNAFYDLAPAAAGAFGAALVKPKIAVASTASLLPDMRGGRISGRIEYSIAFVPAVPKKPFPITQPIAFYSQPDPAYPKFPGGFEVKIAGPAGHRKVGMRLLLMSNYRAGKYESQQGFVTASARF
jgi:prepilin-type N-terminal cleavage/methylation domain-containing protein